jgi:CheY-like chemotaxis protein
MRNLLIEDNNGMTFLIEAMLRRIYPPGTYTLTGVRNGREALDLLTAQAQFDIVLSNIRMPALNGFDLAHVLRSDIRGAGLRLIMVSAYDPGYARRYLPPGIRYLQKPFTLSQLQSVLG